MRHLRRKRMCRWNQPPVGSRRITARAMPVESGSSPAALRLHGTGLSCSSNAYERHHAQGCPLQRHSHVQSAGIARMSSASSLLKVRLHSQAPSLCPYRTSGAAKITDTSPQCLTPACCPYSCGAMPRCNRSRSSCLSRAQSLRSVERLRRPGARGASRERDRRTDTIPGLLLRLLERLLHLPQGSLFVVLPPMPLGGIAFASVAVCMRLTTSSPSQDGQ